MNVREPSIHMLLCVAAVVAGALVFFGVFHPNQHQSTGIILAAVGVLLLV